MKALLALSFGLLASPALAADCLVVDGATVHLPAGPQATSIVVVGERIAAIGAPVTAVDAASGQATWDGSVCAYLDASGKQISAGLIDSSTQLGLVEVSLEGSSHDKDAGGSDEVRAAFEVADAYDPRSSLIAIARLGGITSALANPSGGLLPGASAFVDLAGRRQSEAVVDSRAAWIANLGSRPAKSATLDRLSALLTDARDAAANQRAVQGGSYRDLLASPRDLAALGVVLAGDAPLILNADRAADLEAIARFATREKVRVVVRGAAEGWLVSDLLAEAGVAVILDPTVYGAGSFDQLGGRADNPAQLKAAGVEVLIATGSSHHSRGLRQLAGNAVRGGMSHADALDAITGAPARAFGQRDRGVVAVGAVANLVVWSGDPLEVTTWADAVFVRGVQQPHSSRQTVLRDRYRELPGSPLAPLSLPE